MEKEASKLPKMLEEAWKKIAVRWCGNLPHPQKTDTVCELQMAVFTIALGLHIDAHC